MSGVCDLPAGGHVEESDAIDAVATPLPVPVPIKPAELPPDLEKEIAEEVETTPMENSNVGPPPPGRIAPHVTGISDVDKTPGVVHYPAPGSYVGAPMPNAGHQQIPLTINQLAIVASAQNKLPVSKVKTIVSRVGRHTESSLSKSGRWYKSDSYCDKDNYTWRNMALFEEYQRHMWTDGGTVRDSYKK